MKIVFLAMFCHRSHYRLICVLALVVSLFLSAFLVVTHNHIEDLGQPYDLNCPVCRIIIGLILIFISVALSLIGVVFLGRIARETKVVACFQASISRASRSPPFS